MYYLINTILLVKLTIKYMLKIHNTQLVEITKYGKPRDVPLKERLLGGDFFSSLILLQIPTRFL